MFASVAPREVLARLRRGVAKPQVKPLIGVSDPYRRGNSAIGNGGGYLFDSVNHSVFTGNTARNTGAVLEDGFAIGPSSSGNEFGGTAAC
jgi:hypothetical protein